MSDDTKLAVGSITQLTTEPALPIGGEGALWAAGAQSRRITELEAALAAKDQEIESARKQFVQDLTVIVDELHVTSERLKAAEALLRELVECHDEARRPSSGLIERTGNPDTQARYRRSIAAWERARAYFQSKDGEDGR